MHDIPYIKGPVGPEIIAAMTRICSDVKHILPNIPCGLQVYKFTLETAFKILLMRV
jgi:predicted TIM-barrel enzyme